ncbi:MAG: putative lipid II flippase FtsW [Verrucomicrobia bacterium]|nr:putative lipid II flippase FtsW [Verrucomicrobiota bacterium]MBS0645099.1 putative lipid II flippase FtsW [Verrucomicrobiota bacterium]
MLVIFSLGLLMVFNTSSADILDRCLNSSLHYALIRQGAYACVGLILAFLLSRIGYEHLLRFSPYLLVVGIVFLLLVFVPKIGLSRNGSHRWIGIGHFTFQPSELIKFLVPMTFIDWVLRQKQMDTPMTFKRFVKMMAFLSIPLILVMKEPDNGATAIIGASLLPIFFIAKIPLRYWAFPALGLLLVAGTVAYQLPYVRGRLNVYLHPESDLKGKGHQAYQAKIAAGSGGLTGRGPGGSLQKLTYLPEAQNDYIAAIFAEEFGFLGMLALIILYMTFTYAGFAIALRCSNAEGCYLAVCITFLIALQAFLNLGVVSGLLPSKGVNLPFFSQGGTSLVTNILALTMLLGVGRKADAQTNHS